ncbi:carboxyl-terminal processing protease [Sphingobacterium zeae]|uniref:Carboxyl-terminal processing protease n=1 Tax=Sphingobacterium zeae TaxID=1776859 RepID=A0ABU0U5Y1_9SPHI|nr:carboxyl-terminal processing protease [Sphingobacterium zeae]
MQVIKYPLFQILLFLCLSSFSQTFKSDSVKSFVDNSINLIRSNAVDTTNINLIESILYSKAKNLDTVSDLAPLYTEVFRLLRDHHGSLKYKDRTYGWDKAERPENTYLKGRLKTEKAVVSQIIDRRTAYLRIPGNHDFAFKKVDSIANDITAHINKVSTAKIKAWIIDLRTNTGGNMYPIFLGLQEFIGDNMVFGGFRNAQGLSSGQWEIRDGNMRIDGIKLLRQVQLKKPLKKDIPLIILTSCYTASAGEMTAISLIGRKNTYIVGEPTADYTTAVQGFTISKEAGINLSTDYVVDRNSKIYTGNILPDVEVLQGDNFENLKRDKKILKALELLNK